jgi:amino acid adenylation domain-containing protein/non-ribosomal peptide synthase protein (TIGR01720 family)
MRLGLFQVEEDRHKLVWSFHHMILDGWSLPLVIRDVIRAYEKQPVPERRPYRDFIEWLLQQDQQNAESHWRGKLQGFTEKTPLVVGRRIPMEAPAADSTFQQAFRRLPQGLTARLAEFARTYHLTTGTLVYGAWAMLLGRYSGARETVFGCNVSGRPAGLPGVDTMVGLFINTLPLRVATSGAVPVTDWLRTLQAQVMEALEFQSTPLAKIQKWSSLPGGQSLFDSIVVVENYPTLGDAPAGGGLQVEYQSWTKHSKTGYPITLLALPGDELLFEINFDTRLFDASAIERMLGHIEALLEGMAARPEGTIDQLSVLSRSEEAALLRRCLSPEEPVGAVRGSIPLDGGSTLQALFEKQVRRCPGAIALTCGTEQLTYGELNARANRLARELARHGVAPDTLAGLYIERSNELVIALLAILKAGGAYLPIDLSYPAERMRFMLEDAQAPVLVTQRKLASGLPPVNAKVLCIEDLADDGDDTDVPPYSGADHLAYVIYTSGTTGQPKGSLITHRNVVRLFSSTDHWYSFNERDVWTLFHSCAFDFSVWEIWGALLYGGRLVVIPFETSRSPEAFYQVLGDEGVTVLNQTPSAFRQLIQAEAEAPRSDLRLRYVIFGGEALEMESLRPWFDRHGDRKPRLVNMYGITETTVHVTYRPLSKDDLQSGSVIGVPIPDLQVYVLDARQKLVPEGAPGEMYVGGAGLARGYLRRPELTAQRFIPDHISGKPGARLYRTGDLARLLPGRDIEYLGRIDQQVKIRGFRIELGEIQSVLLQHPSVREAVVVAREDAPGLKRLVGYVAASHPVPEVTALRDYLKQKLPEYMTPAAFVFIDKLPLTSNGKIDQRALPAPEEHRPDLAARYVAPRNPIEAKLVEIWSKVLRLEQVGVHDNFFELGGDSILSIQIISLARREGIYLTPKLLFANQTIAALAAAGTAPAEMRTASGDVAGDVPLTPIQHWFFEQELEEPHHYNQAFLFEVIEPMHQALLEQALAAMCRQHDALRLRYRKEAAGWRQFYSTETEQLPLWWLSLADAGERSAERLQEETARAQASLDLEHGPLWRAVYFDRGAEESGRLLLVVHHLAIDGVSWRALLEDLEEAYRQLKAGQAVRVPEKSASYQTWAARLQQFARDGGSAGEIAYWKGVVEGARVTVKLNAVRDGASNLESSAETCTLYLSAEETQTLLQTVPAVYNTQINDVLLAALSRAWGLWTGGSRLYMNLEGHGRENFFEDLDLSRTAGWFTSIFPVLLEAPAEEDGGWNPCAVLKSVKEQLRQIPRRGAGYSILRYLSGDTGLPCEPEMVFNYLGQFDQVLASSTLFRLAGESTGKWHSPKQRRRYALEVNSMVVRGRLQFAFTYSRNLHDVATIQRLSDAFGEALREIAAHCLSPEAGGRTPSDFPLARLDQAAIDRLVGSRRDIEDIYPLSPIQTLFLSAAPGAAHSAFDHWQCTLHGELDVATFQRAWRETLRRHPVLRSTFHTDGLPAPVQMVHRDPEPRWTIEDWRTDDSGVDRWKDYLGKDHACPLSLTESPVMRFALVRVADREWKFLWSVPALLLDGWSWPVVFRDASRLYAALSSGAAVDLEPVRPYRDYIEWLERQSPDEAKQYWRQALAGFREPTALPSEPTEWDGAGGRYARYTVDIPAAITPELQGVAKRLQTTLSTLIQGAWALVLGQHCSRRDVVFGAAFAGRPADLPAVESIAGPFVNNLPVRVNWQGPEPLEQFLQRLHGKLLEVNPHQFTPLPEIQRESEVPWRFRLFESLIVFQNYLVDDSARRFGNAIRIEDFDGPIHTNYAVLLLAEPGPALRLTLIYDRSKIAGAAAERWAGDLSKLLTHLPFSLNRTAGELTALLSRPIEVAVSPKRETLCRTGSHVPPQNEMEKVIAAVWERFFGLDKISIEETFFDLGGHSLLLVQMHRELQEVLKVNFSVVDIFEHPTIRTLAKHLSQPAENMAENVQQLRGLAQRRKDALTRLRVKLKK